MAEETWKPVKGYEGLYEVSDAGRVRNYSTKRVFSVAIAPTGYIVATLTKNGEHKQKLVHRLVADAFIPNPDRLPLINHKDENPQNNSVSNLEWCTTRYNLLYGTAPARRIKNISKPLLQLSMEGIPLRKWNSAAEVERELGFKKSNICKCRKGIFKSAYGFLWRPSN